MSPSDVHRLDGKVALITGGASGIGAESGRRMAEAGAHVVLCDVQPDGARAVADEIGSAALAVALDVASEEDWRSAVASGESAFGKVDVVLNCAGISVPAPIDELTMEGWRKTMSVNADGVFLGCKYGVDALRRAGGGSIINIASSLAIRAGSKYAAYCASKGAVMTLTRAVALRCAEQDWNIRCNAICPAVIETPILDKYLAQSPTREDGLAKFGQQHPMGRVGRPEEIAHVAVFLASDASSFMTGAEIPVDGGLCA